LLVLLIFVCNVQASPYQLVVNKSSKQLLVKEGDDVIKRYRIASGRGGYGTKTRMGDNKTPVGSYKIIELRENSRFHFFMQINYPNTLDAWYGYNKNLINGREFKDIVSAVQSDLVPPQDTSLGGSIGLHGIGEVTDKKLSIHDRLDWTEGCIALTNEEISELRQYVSVGTTIIIKD
jgi:murein L,D-transpeptidase YafK